MQCLADAFAHRTLHALQALVAFREDAAEDAAGFGLGALDADGCEMSNKVGPSQPIEVGTPIRRRGTVVGEFVVDNGERGHGVSLPVRASSHNPLTPCPSATTQAPCQPTPSLHPMPS